MSAQENQDKDGWRSIRKKAISRDGGACRFCDISNEEHEDEHGRELSVHHIIPKAEGGDDALDNLITVCQSCHRTLESTQASALSQIEPGLSPTIVKEIRRDIHHARDTCEWLWNDQLPRLKTIPEIEDMEPAGINGMPAYNPDLTDKEVACYILGWIKGYSHLGSLTEYNLDKTDPDEVRELDYDFTEGPSREFLRGDGERSKFRNMEPW